MSKLDRQLDDVYGESRVRLDWSRVEECIDEVRQHLKNEIDEHKARIPLDLRSIRGAPHALIDLLVECQQYAADQGKVLSVSTALPPMQDALYGLKRKKPGRQEGAASEDASQSAQSILDTRRQDASASIPPPHPRKTASSPSRRKLRPFWKRYAIHIAVILGLTAMVAIVEYFLIFHADHETVAVPTKTFEQ
ncbi:hypothetical protein [Stieleria varia]|uniref:Uncharacterized protein n=1 Tax=Stieleria varia TaxID=2528005 RepID=A0A5C6AWD4_9BACT|nr:hypothetical protein [Stieleria varia]TWU04253.1 hypothetical protein Pla52n_22920 [Stieleria varia]